MRCIYLILATTGIRNCILTLFFSQHEKQRHLVAEPTHRSYTFQTNGVQCSRTGSKTLQYSDNQSCPRSTVPGPFLWSPSTTAGNQAFCIYAEKRDTKRMVFEQAQPMCEQANNMKSVGEMKLKDLFLLP